MGAPKAELLMDLRTGEIIHSMNIDDRLHPASITKLMTLYVTFNALESGRISLGDTTTVSKHAADRPPSKMNLKTGQVITIADLIRGVAIQSANDGATALAEAVGGSETQFVNMMNQTAAQMGMTSTNFVNPHGLTDNKQLTTARDLSTLARRMYYDHAGHYGLFSQKETTINGQKFLSTNRRFLSGYQGATGLKTGYTRAAGYNLAASAMRNGIPLLSIVLGADSSPDRFERTAAMMNWGFKEVNPLVVANAPAPLGMAPLMQAPSGIPEHQSLRTALSSPAGTAFVSDIVSGHSMGLDGSGSSKTMVNLPDKGGFRPILIAMQESAGQWGVQIGLYPSRYLAEQSLLRTTLSYIDTLGAAPPSVAEVGTSWSAAYTHMSKRQAESACRSLLENKTNCAIFKY